MAGMGELSGALRAEIEEKMLRRKADFTYKELGGVGAVFVAEKLRGNTVVEELWLNRCGIGALGTHALAESLSGHNLTLKKLFLYSNDVGDDGAQSMAQMLRKNTTLKELHLGSCSVGAVGARALGEALKGNSTLKAFRLGDNDIGDEGANIIADAMRDNESLKDLNLWGCQLTDVGASSLLSTLRESNSSLTYLDVSLNRGIKDNMINGSIDELLAENEYVVPASAEQRARCLLFCCLQLAPTAHLHALPSIGAVPVPVMQYAVEHAGQMHVAKRFEVGDAVVAQSSAGVRGRSTLSSAADGSDLEPAAARRR